MKAIAWIVIALVIIGIVGDVNKAIKKGYGKHLAVGIEEIVSLGITTCVFSLAGRVLGWW